MSIVVLCLRFGFALLFVAAGVRKLVDRDRFREAVTGYALLPTRLVAPVARAVAPVEILCGVLVGTGFAPTVAPLVLSALLLSFAAAAAVNLARGRRVACGCWGARGDTISSSLVVRNVALAALAAMLAFAAVPFQPWPGGARDVSADQVAPLLAATGGVLTAAALAAGAARLRAMVARLQLADDGQ